MRTLSVEQLHNDNLKLDISIVYHNNMRTQYLNERILRDLEV